MSPAKTTAERVAALRAAREAMGLKRLELYVHPDDWPAIKALAEKLQRKRARLVAKRAPTTSPPPRTGPESPHG